MARSFKDEMTIDPETGLPALPENLAWKVDRYGSKILCVILVSRYEERLGFWAKLFGKTPEVSWQDHYLGDDGGRLYANLNGETKEDLLKTTKRLYAQAHAHATHITELDDLVGLYPPKSIL